eukprot:scaffold1706_cov116-Cylindrotheca_fusiformis.AAC.15
MNNNAGQQLGNGENSMAQRSQTNANQPGMLYDSSSFDPLQAHARQLAASAGLSSLMPNPATTQTNGMGDGDGDSSRKMQQHVPIHSQQVPKNQLKQQPASQHTVQNMPQHAPQAQARTSQPYFYLQAPNSGTGALPSIAPNTQQQTIAPVVPQPVGQAAQSFILPAGTPGTSLGIPNNFQAAIFPNNLNNANTQGMMNPGLLMAQQLQSQQLMPSSLRQDGGDHLSQGARKKQRTAEPSVISSQMSASASGSGKSKASSETDEFQDPNVDLSKMTPAQRRRHERNMREQQRSYKISQQIKELREVLSDSNVPFKPNKYSILLSVVDYIKQLQSRAIMLDSEHQKLITTIRQTNEMVNSGATPSSADETDGTNTSGNMSSSDPGSDGEMVFVQGLNYRNLFEQCPAALGIAALDGRLLECNPEFQSLLGFPREELLKQSLFNLIRNHQDIFRAMAEMLKAAEEGTIDLGRDSASGGSNTFVWSGPIVSKQDIKLSMNLTLTVDNGGTPKFFSCSVAAI